MACRMEVGALTILPDDCLYGNTTALRPTPRDRLSQHNRGSVECMSLGSSPTCHHPECPRLIPFGRLACPHHWYALPRPLQRLINAAWDDRISGEDDGAHEHWKAQAVRWWMEGTWEDEPFVPAPAHYRPPGDITMGVFAAHALAEHGVDAEAESLTMDLVAVCTCGTTMDPTETRSPNVGVFYDYFRCSACGNTGRIRRSEP